MVQGRKHRRDGHKYLQSLASELLARVGHVAKGRAEAVHHLRVCARRLRTILPLLVQDPEARHVRQARRMLRKIARAASGTRDHDVRIDLLKTFSAEDIRAMRGLRQKLQSARRHARHHMLDEISDIDTKRLRKLLNQQKDEIVPATETLARIETQQRSALKTLRESLTRLGRRFEPSELHMERRRLRRLRYAVEVRDHLLRRESGALLLLRQMQAELGDIHDMYVLAQWLQSQASTVQYRSASEKARALHKAWLQSGPMRRLESVANSLDLRGIQ